MTLSPQFAIPLRLRIQRLRRHIRVWIFFPVFKDSATPVGRCSSDLTEHHFCLAALLARVCSFIVSVMKNISHSKPSEKDPGVF